MDGWRLLTSGAVFAATFSILYLSTLPKDHGGTSSSRNLVISVLSARDHFLQRDAIRRTWGSDVARLQDADLLFIVGEDCPIHPEDRMSPYSCDGWNILPEDIDDPNPKRFFKRGTSKKKSVSGSFECYIGLGFQILHPVVLDSISIPAELLSRIGNCTVLLQDAEEVLETWDVTFNSCSEESQETAYCDIKIMQPLLLPKQFEGELRIFKEGIFHADLCSQDYYSLQSQKNWVCDWTSSSVIKYKFFRSADNVFSPWNENSCSLVSAEYSVADRDILRKHVENRPKRSSAWQEHLNFVLNKIAIEQVVHRDMIFLPHLDVYSRLPQKVIMTLRRLSFEMNFNFMMKIDDDTLVNVSSLKTLIESENADHPRMWSRFHHHRSVPLYGKWADTKYASLTYPSFPSGAGYLMSGSLAQSLADAGPYLTSYVGEDVSIGIWISSVVESAILVDVPCWLPRFECQETMLISQLSPIDMIEMWKNFS